MSFCLVLALFTNSILLNILCIQYTIKHREFSVICEYMQTKHFVVSLALIMPFLTQAQTEKDSSTNRQVVIEEVYKPKFQDVQKIESVPVVEKPSLKLPIFDYQIKAHQVSTEKIISPIPAVELPYTNTTTMPFSFAKLGYGNLKTPLAEIYLSNGADQKFSYGGHYKFLQTNSQYNNGLADFTQHNGRLFASAFTKTSELGLQLNYNQHQYYYYGIDTAKFKNEFNRDSLKRSIQNFDAQVNYSNQPNGSGKLKHHTKLNYNQFGIDNALEQDYAISSKLSLSLKKMGELKNGKLSSELGFDYTSFKLDTNPKYNRTFLQIDPRFEFDLNKVHLNLGFNAMFFMQANQPSQNYINPVIHVSYPILEGVAKLYAGIDGRYKKQSLKQLIGTNPFLNQYDLLNTYENIKTHLGVSSKFGSKADGLFEIAYADVSNMPLFVSKNDSLNSFTTLMTQVSVLKFSTAINYALTDKIKWGLSGNFYNYDVSNQTEAWQMPSFDAKSNLSLNIKDKCFPHLDILAFGTQQQKTEDLSKVNPTPKYSTIKPFCDISLGVDYKIKNRYSAFIQANNLLNNRYQRWYNYPVYGLNVIAGLTVKF